MSSFDFPSFFLCSRLGVTVRGSSFIYLPRVGYEGHVHISGGEREIASIPEDEACIFFYTSTR